MVGLISFKDIDYLEKKTEIGYWISKEYQKKGIVTQSVKAICNFGFTKLGLNCITIKAATNNTKSNNTPQRLSFTFEGTEKNGELLSDGTYTDLEVYQMYSKDFN